MVAIAAILQRHPDYDQNMLNVLQITHKLWANLLSCIVEDGLGIAVCFDSIINVNNKHNDNLVFVPINDMSIDIDPALIWKKYQVLSRTSKAFIEELQKIL